MEYRPLTIIGGGPAGLSAAAAARQSGVRDVLLIERNHYLGGILNQCIHPGFGLELLGQNLTGPEYAQRYIALAAEAGVECWTDTMVTGLNRQRELTACGPHGLSRIHAQAVILAMGCRERTRGAISLPGTRPAGIFTAGTAQHLINLQNRMIGRRVVILGSGDIGLIMARRLTLEGAEVLAVVEKLPYPGGLPRNIAQCLEDFGIPLYLSHTVVEVHGNRRVSGVTIAGLGPRGGIVRGNRRKIDCDTLLLSVGLIPENELSREAGIILDDSTGGPGVDSTGQTDIPGIFACGNAVYVHDIVDQVTREAEAVGRAAADYLLKGESPAACIPVHAGQGIRCLSPQRVQPDAKISLSLRVMSPAGKRELTCIICPAGCRIKLEYQGNSVIRIEGALCSRGKQYAEKEIVSPTRLLTTTMEVEGGELPLVSIRTDAELPKDLIMPAMHILARIKVAAPVNPSQVLAENILGTGVNIIATRKVDVAMD